MKSRKINAFLLNIKLNRPKLANICGFKLATNWQNFMVIYLARVKILQNVFGATFFDSHCSFLTPNFMFLSLGVHPQRVNEVTRDEIKNLTSNPQCLGNVARQNVFSDKKLLTSFRFSPKSVTLNDLECCNGRYFALLH